MHLNDVFIIAHRKLEKEEEFWPTNIISFSVNQHKADVSSWYNGAPWLWLFNTTEFIVLKLKLNKRGTWPRPCLFQYYVIHISSSMYQANKIFCCVFNISTFYKLLAQDLHDAIIGKWFTRSVFRVNSSKGICVMH